MAQDGWNLVGGNGGGSGGKGEGIVGMGSLSHGIYYGNAIARAIRLLDPYSVG